TGAGWRPPGCNGGSSSRSAGTPRQRRRRDGRPARRRTKPGVGGHSHRRGATRCVCWDAALTEERGDQNADSAVDPPKGTSAYYSLGPDSDRNWGLELITVDHGEELDATYLGASPSEDKAKAAAEAHERRLTDPRRTP